MGVAVAFLSPWPGGALRLARFNVGVATTSKRFFIGLPIPACGCALATFVLFRPYLPDWLAGQLPYICLGLAFFLPLLMVSRVRHFSFKEYGFLRAHPFSTLVAALLLFVLIFSAPRMFCFLLCLGYILSGLVLHLSAAAPAQSPDTAPPDPELKGAQSSHSQRNEAPFSRLRSVFA